MTTKNSLVPKLGIIHNHGATFAYEPVGGSNVSILFDVSRTKDGIKFYRKSERGPWGDTQRISKGEDEMNKQWEDLLSLAIHESYTLLSLVEGNSDETVFDAEIIDSRTK